MLLDRTFFSCLCIGVVASIGALGCGDDTDGVGANGGNGSGGNGSGAGGSGVGGSGGSGGEATIACGDDLVCEGETVCIVEPNEPACENLVNEADPCPAGTTKTNCGGAGIPCCCEPTPPPDHRCAPSTSCGEAAPTCECLDPCDAGEECTAVGGEDATFQCEPPPAA